MAHRNRCGAFARSPFRWNIDEARRLTTVVTKALAEPVPHAASATRPLAPFAPVPPARTSPLPPSRFLPTLEYVEL